MKLDGAVKGTGDLAESIAKVIEHKGWGDCLPVTRHQLLIHPDIPYTSHNSAMCFEADILNNCLKAVIDSAADFLTHESAPDSDPGLCVAITDRISRPGWLIAFGYIAKNYVLTKEKAYELAQRLDIHLSEHGGTGQGIIGALAGAGLRLGGNDGRYKGQVSFMAGNSLISVTEICAQGKVDLVKSLEEGIILKDDDLVKVGDRVKAVRLYGKSVLLVYPIKEEAKGTVCWQTYSKSQLRDF
jgi:hypothetical protein